MMRKNVFLLFVAAVVVALFLFRIATAGRNDDPFEFFNVYSLGNIGLSTNPCTSDFQGVAGTGVSSS